MKLRIWLLLPLAAASLCFTNACQTTRGDADESPEGISGAGMGMTRESIYKMQERTFRQLAY